MNKKKELYLKYAGYIGSSIAFEGFRVLKYSAMSAAVGLLTAINPLIGIPVFFVSCLLPTIDIYRKRTQENFVPSSEYVRLKQRISDAVKEIKRIRDNFEKVSIEELKESIINNITLIKTSDDAFVQLIEYLSKSLGEMVKWENSCRKNNPSRHELIVKSMEKESILSPTFISTKGMFSNEDKVMINGIMYINMRKLYLNQSLSKIKKDCKEQIKILEKDSGDNLVITLNQKLKLTKTSLLFNLLKRELNYTQIKQNVTNYEKSNVNESQKRLYSLLIRIKDEEYMDDPSFRDKRYNLKGIFEDLMNEYNFNDEGNVLKDYKDYDFEKCPISHEFKKFMDLFENFRHKIQELNNDEIKTYFKNVDLGKIKKLNQNKLGLRVGFSADTTLSGMLKEAFFFFKESFSKDEIKEYLNFIFRTRELKYLYLLSDKVTKIKKDDIASMVESGNIMQLFDLHEMILSTIMYSFQFYKAEELTSQNIITYTDPNTLVTKKFKYFSKDVQKRRERVLNYVKKSNELVGTISEKYLELMDLLNEGNLIEGGIELRESQNYNPVIKDTVNHLAKTKI